METVEGSISLKVRGEPVEFAVRVPKGSVGVPQMLPVLRQMTDTLVEAMTRRAARDGENVSCRAGCGACCKQMVPIAPSEALALRGVVEQMPEARRTEVLARFADAVDRLEAASLAAPLRRAEARVGRSLRELGLAYFALGIECPFLEEGSCSVYPDRPLACREYLVSTPAAHCAQPTPETVKTIPMPARLSNGLLQIDGVGAAEASTFVVLTLAIEYAEAHPEGTGAMERPGTDLLRDAMRAMTGKDL